VIAAVAQLIGHGETTFPRPADQGCRRYRREGGKTREVPKRSMQGCRTSQTGLNPRVWIFYSTVVVLRSFSFRLLYSDNARLEILMDFRNFGIVSELTALSRFRIDGTERREGDAIR
jgi:hypothetical protein